MANATIVRSRRYRERNRYVYEGVAAFPTTALTCTLPIPSVGKVLYVDARATGAPAAGTAYVQTGAGTVSASAKVLQIVDRTGTISAVDFTVSTTVATDAANIWTVGVLNKTATLTPVDISVAANSNTTTTGAAFTAYTPRALTLGVAGQLVVTAGDVLEWTFTKASSAANLIALQLRTTIATATGVTDFVYPPSADATSGYFTVSSGAITIARVSPNPTSAQQFQFRIEHT